MRRKTKDRIEATGAFFAWATGFLTAMVIGYALIAGPLFLPEPFGGHIVSNSVGWLTIGSALVTIILSFFRK